MLDDGFGASSYLLIHVAHKVALQILSMMEMSLTQAGMKQGRAQIGHTLLTTHQADLKYNVRTIPRFSLEGDTPCPSNCSMISKGLLIWKK